MLDYQDAVGSKLWADGFEPIEQPEERWSSVISVRWVEDSESLIVSKAAAGLDTATIGELRQIVADVADGATTPKFLVFDFAHGGEARDGSGPAFDHLIAEVADLIARVPVVTVAWARARMAGADLDLALACSMMAGEELAQFSFAADPLASFRTYARLVHKLGFVRAERLMEDGEVLDADEMKSLLLLKEIAPPMSGLAGIEAFLRRKASRHNSQCGIYRAQRIAMRSFAGGEAALRPL